MFLRLTDSQPSAAERLKWSAILLPVAIAFAFFVRMPLSWQDQALFSGLVVAVTIVVGRLSTSRYVTSVLTIMSVFCSLRYIVWRWSSSVTYLNHSGWRVDAIGLIFALLLLSAESYSVIVLLLGYFQSAAPLRRKPVPMNPDVSTWPAVDIFVPTYNESLDVVRSTVLAALEIDWPQDRKKVYILDDGRRPEFREFAEQCGAGYITRTDNKHAKAGNINAALKKTSGEYIAIFDCDHISTRSFLQLTMGLFGHDKRLALVQTPHHFYSPDPFERNLNLFRKIPNEGALFYGVVQDGNDLWNATFFCGSCAVIRRDALEEIGGIAVETVTEDAHTALRLQRRGWNTAYIGIPQAAGLATGSLAAHVGQRIRWARGMVQILRTEFPLFASGLNLSQRFCYLNCAMHYLYAIPRLVFITAPLVYLLLGVSNLYGFLWEILAYAAPHLILSNLVNSRTQGAHRHSFWNEVYEMVLAPYILMPTTFALINPKWGKFNVTAKDSVVEESYFDWKIARPYLCLIALNVVAIISALPRYFTSGDPSGVLLINVLWAVLNTMMLGACVAVCVENKQRRSTARVEANLTATLDFGDGQLHPCAVLDLSEGGLALRAESNLAYNSDCVGTVTIRSGGEDTRFAVRPIRTSDNRIQLRFLGSNLKHQRDITKLIYARADSWLDWNKDQKRDRILSSFIHVLGIGATGIWTIPGYLVRQQKKTEIVKPKKLSRVLPVVLAALLLFHTVSLRAQTVPALPVAAPSSSADRAELTFSDHQSFSDLNAKSAFVLTGQHTRNTLNFVLPGTKIVSDAELTLYAHGGEIAVDEPLEMALVLNGVEISTISLTDSVLNQPVKIALPSDLLVHENSLSFEMRHAAMANAAAPVKKGWLRIEPISELHTSGLLLALPNRLSMLPEPFFDRSLQGGLELPVVLDPRPDTETLRAAGIVASWFGSLSAHRGAHYTSSLGHLPKGNVVLLAHSHSPLAQSLSLTDPIVIAIRENPSDKYGKVLALIAPDGPELAKLALLLGTDRLAIDSDQLVFSEEALSSLTPGTSETVRWQDATHPINLTANLAESLLSARLNSPSQLYFRLAPDLDYGSKITVPLQLSYRLNGLHDGDHVWASLFLNNTFVTKRRLSLADAGSNRRQSFAIPVSLLFSSNTLRLELFTDKQEATVSDPNSVELQILPDSTLDLQNPTHFVQMPRLDLFAASGFPFTQRANLADTTVVLPEFLTTAQIGLYLDAISFLSAQSGTVASKFTVVHAKELLAGTSNNILVVSSANDDATFAPLQRSMVIVPAGGKFTAGNTQLAWREWISRAWLGRREELQRLDSLLDRESSLRFMLEGFGSPYYANRSVVVVATRSESDDSAYFQTLLRASREGAVAGGLTLADSDHFFSFSLNPSTYFLGDASSRAAVFGWLRFHLWILPLVLLVLSAIVARWWEGVLARQAEYRFELMS